MPPSEGAHLDRGAIATLRTSKISRDKDTGEGLGSPAPVHISAGKNSSSMESNRGSRLRLLCNFFTSWELLIMFLTIARKFFCCLFAMFV
jgi:hypothetical protein